LILKKPEIIDLSKDRTRLSCDIYDNDKLKTLYFEVDKKYKKYLCYERSDAFIISILPYAMLSGQDIYCETPVTETLLYNINEVLIPNLASGFRTKYKLIKIHANVDNTPIKGIKVSTGHSLGVDAFYTIFKTMNSNYDDYKLSHLLYIKRPHAETKLAKHYNIVEKTANSLNLPLTFIITNVRTLWSSLHGNTHVYTNLGAAYAMRKLINTYYYSTAYDLNDFSIANAHESFADDYLLLLAYSFTIPDFNVLMGGLDTHRHDKIIPISKHELVQKNLKVCITSDFNCSVCWKCKRSIMEFDMLGVLGNYREVFDVDYYLNNKIEYFKTLCPKSNLLTKVLYDYFIKKEPKLFINVKKIFFEDMKNLSATDFKAEYGLMKKKVHCKNLNKIEKIKKSMPKPIKKVLKKIIIRKILS
jgi:hypothetical protein